MFTGIIENLATVRAIRTEGTNIHLDIASTLTDSLKIDQSVSHNGVCLTVVDIKDDVFTVTAIAETLRLTNLNALKTGDKINIERAMVAGARLDGHQVQGHVDTTARCIERRDENGSWLFRFAFDAPPQYILVPKGSVTVNGVSLTVVEPKDREFSVAIIPFTFENTTFHQLKVGDFVNIEFDIIGKYISQHIEAYLKAHMLQS
ncbi:MAG: hypothetical protein RL757_1998 [Bacteroidota bacterium]|jgi:riboflavin synthase